jgi:hypothetical protein
LASRQHDHQAGWIADMLLDPRANPKSGKAIAIQKRRFGHGFIHAENLPIFGAQSNRALPRLIGRLQPLATRIRPHKSPKSQFFEGDVRTFDQDCFYKVWRDGLHKSTCC